MTRYENVFILIICCLSCLSILGCSDDDNGPTSTSRDMVVNPLPLAVGNRWDYFISQSMGMDTTGDNINDIVVSSAGYQSVSINNTEAFEEGEAFGMEFRHILQRLSDPSAADTTIEIQYVLPTKDKILLKALESVYNNTGGFVPFGNNDDEEIRKAYTRISVGGREVEITLDELGRLLLEPLPSYVPGQQLDNLLASDGVQNNEDVTYYDFDYIYLFDELYKGLSWISAEALGVGGIEISQEVTAILDGLDGFEGPIAEVTVANTFIDFFQSEQLLVRYYYKTGIGVIRAEIYDPAILVYYFLSDNTLIIGEGEWAVLKQLAAYTVK